VLWCVIQQYFSYIVAVRYIGGPEETGVLRENHRLTHFIK
jgi:hypothetical protein